MLNEHYHQNQKDGNQRTYRQQTPANKPKAPMDVQIEDLGSSRIRSVRIRQDSIYVGLEELAPQRL